MSIPAKNIVNVNPGVITGGGSALSLNGVILTENALLPAGSVRSFVSPAGVSAFFGPSSTEYALAQIYFLGYDNSTVKPGNLIFAPYIAANQAAWLQSGSLAGMTQTQLDALSGTLTVTVDGTPFTSSSIVLTGLSFSAAAAAIAAAFTGVGKPTCAWDAVNSTFTLTSSTTGASSSITACTGTLAEGLLLAADDAIIMSQGAVADTPATAMANVVKNTQNWATFMTVFEPLIADKENFAIWNTAQNQRYAYICWDTDAQAIVQGSSTCFGAVATAAEYDGVVPVYNSAMLAAFVLGTVASINFAQTNGRITTAFRSQEGFTATVTDEQIAANLLANGYSYYGAYATANQNFNFFYNGQMTGTWKWLDTFVDQVYLNSQFQLVLMVLVTSIGSIPYNEPGYSLVRAAMADPINAALNFGSFRTGVTLSASEAAQVNAAAGKTVDQLITQQGYYLQVLDPGAQVRTNRGTPVINFFYTDGGAVQQLTLASIDMM